MVEVAFFSCEEGSLSLDLAQEVSSVYFEELSIVVGICRKWMEEEEEGATPVETWALGR